MNPKIKKLIAKGDSDALVYSMILIFLILGIYLLATDGLIWLISLSKAQSFWDGIRWLTPKMYIGIVLLIGEAIFLYRYEKRKFKEIKKLNEVR